MTRTDYHVVTRAGAVCCTHDTLGAAIRHAQEAGHAIPGLSVVRVDTAITTTPVWPEPAKLRAVA